MCPVTVNSQQLLASGSYDRTVRIWAPDQPIPFIGSLVPAVARFGTKRWYSTANSGRTVDQGVAAARRRWPGVSAGVSLDEARLAHAGPRPLTPRVSVAQSLRRPRPELPACPARLMTAAWRVPVIRRPERYSAAPLRGWTCRHSIPVNGRFAPLTCRTTWRRHWPCYRSAAPWPSLPCTHPFLP
jgi:hypothetical protein